MGMIRFLFLALLLTCADRLLAQEYLVQGSTPDLYLTHKVQPKETWYGLGRTYNLEPARIASYNNTSISRPLSIGEDIRVPLTGENFSQPETRPTGEGYIPVYHIVQDREWMYRISVNHNKVPIERLEKWNNISRDNATAGTRLIVGFLKGGDAAPAAETASTRPAPAPEQHRTSPSQPQTPPQTTPSPSPTVRRTGAAGAGGGFFRSQYEDKGVNSSGTAAVFKSTSGWKDGKYYALMNNVTVGTIIRITYPQTNKAIYAKVLGELPDMKESAGLAIRISDSAASELGAVNSKFTVDVRY